MDNQLLILILCFVAVAIVTFVVSQLMATRDTDGKLRDRLGNGSGGGFERARVNHVLAQIGQAAARPFMPTDPNKQLIVRQNLARAGIYTPAGFRTVAGAKAICLALGVVLGYLVGGGQDLPILVLCLAMGGLVGYVVPMFWLKMRTKSNQLALTNGLADALDLMVVCIEAGLTIDAAMQRIGQELAIAHPSLSREMGLTHMETRVGLSRAEALRNMGQRTGNSALASLASMLIRPNGSAPASPMLRVHSERCASIVSLPQRKRPARRR